VLRPDLYIVELDAPKETALNRPTEISAVVGNMGNYSVQSVILTFYYRDSNGFQRVIGETRVGPIGPGEEDGGSITWVPDTRDDYLIVASVDVDDLVDEEDDDNNRAERALRVGDSAEDAPGPGAVMALAVLALAMLVSRTPRRRDP
jgi:MYXO-CTERM domain-containing protein